MTADLRQAMLEQMELAKTIQVFRKQLSEITMPYEVRLASKDKQIEALSHELQNVVGVNNELRQKLGNNQMEIMRLGVREENGVKNVSTYFGFFFFRVLGNGLGLYWTRAALTFLSGPFFW